MVRLTEIAYPEMLDLGTMSPALAAEAERSLVSNVMLPRGKKFRPMFSVSRAEFAEALVRGGFASQYLASSPMFVDVGDLYTRNSVESVQSGSTGALIVDVSPGGAFYPNLPITKLIAAIAYVRAAGLDSQAATAALPSGIADTNSIPSQYRGHVGVALQRGFIRLDGNAFNPSRSVTRIELAQSLNAMIIE